MAGSVNKVILIGNLGANPELKVLPSGQSVCELRLATNDVWKDKQGQRQERTEWHRVQVWAKQAEFCSQYLHKGSKVYVEGRLQTRSWDDKDGQKQYMTEVVAQQVQFLDSRAGEGAPMRSAQAGGSAPPAGGGEPPADFGPPGGDDDIPF